MSVLTPVQRTSQNPTMLGINCLKVLNILSLLDVNRQTASHHLQKGRPHLVLLGPGSEVAGGEGKLHPPCHRSQECYTGRSPSGQAWWVTAGGKEQPVSANISIKSTKVTLIQRLLTEVAL